MQHNGEQFKANSGVANLDVVFDERKAAFWQEGKRAWDVYQETGLHLTHLEADEWLRQLEVGNDAEPPEGHIWRELT